MKLTKKTYLAFAETEKPVPTNVSFMAISRVKGQEVRQLVCHSKDGLLCAVCRKKDGTLKILGRWEFPVLGWQHEHEVRPEDYRDKDGNCPACAGCSESLERTKKVH